MHGRISTQSDLESRMIGKKITVIMGAIILTLAGAFGGWSVYRTSTREYALEQILEAIRTGNATTIEQNVDFTRVAAGLTEATFSGMMSEFAASIPGTNTARRRRDSRAAIAA
jgi:hypothetical protein